MLNLTPHAITVQVCDRSVTFPPSGRVARVESVESVDEVDGIDADQDDDHGEEHAGERIQH